MGCKTYVVTSDLPNAPSRETQFFSNKVKISTIYIKNSYAPRSYDK